MGKDFKLTKPSMKVEYKILFSHTLKPDSYRILMLNVLSFLILKIDKTKPVASVTNASTSSAQVVPIAVTTPAVPSGQATPTSPIKKVSQNRVCKKYINCV